LGRFVFLWILAFLCVGASEPLIDQDEAAYFGFSKAWMQEGIQSIPDFPFSEPHRKPPLQFWLTTGLFHLFGASEWNMRLVPALSILGSLFLTYRLGNLLFGKPLGELAFLLLSTSLYFPWNGKIALVDALLSFWVSLGVFGFFLFLQTKQNRYLVLLYLSLALGILTKGPPILVFFGGFFFLCLLRPSSRKLFWEMKPILGFSLATLPFVLWIYATWLEDGGEFALWLLDWYVLKRASGAVFGQTAPPGTYLVLFVLGLFPGSLLVFPAWKRLGEFLILKGKGWMRNEFSKETYLLLFLPFGWLF